MSLTQIVLNSQEFSSTKQTSASEQHLIHMAHFHIRCHHAQAAELSLIRKGCTRESCITAMSHRWGP